MKKTDRCKCGCASFIKSKVRENQRVRQGVSKPFGQMPPNGHYELSASWSLWSVIYVYCKWLKTKGVGGIGRKGEQLHYTAWQNQVRKQEKVRKSTSLLLIHLVSNGIHTARSNSRQGMLLLKKINNPCQCGMIRPKMKRRFILDTWLDVCMQKQWQHEQHCSHTHLRIFCTSGGLKAISTIVGYSELKHPCPCGFRVEM